METHETQRFGSNYIGDFLKTQPEKWIVGSELHVGDDFT